MGKATPVSGKSISPEEERRALGCRYLPGEPGTERGIQITFTPLKKRSAFRVTEEKETKTTS